MRFLEILFFLLTTFYIVHATTNNNKLCPTSYCGTKSIDYPFKLQSSQPKNNCTYINLTCNLTQDNNETPSVNLPYGGDFYVRNIENYGALIQLYDPGNCLMGRLIKNLNLTSSPFKAIYYENYTFYMCPVNSSVINYYVLPIDCLSNSTNSMVASALFRPDYMSRYGCEIITSRLLPVLEPGQFEFDGVAGDLYLNWNVTGCKACQDESNQPPADGSDSPWAEFAGSHYFIPSSAIMAVVFVICLHRVTKLITGRNGTNPRIPTTVVQPVSITTATEPPQSTIRGLDDSQINSCTELVALGDNRRDLEPDSNNCSICLESYHLQELVRSIAQCKHCFHAECIELWLRKSRTCPVCRLILSET